MSTDFVHLRVHTEYSLVDGTVRIPELIQSTRMLEMPSVAVTDQSNMFGMVKFYRKALGAGIKPVVGVDVLIAEEDSEDEPTRLTLLCQNDTGYHNLTRLVTRSYMEGQHRGRAILQRTWFADANEGLILLTGGLHGAIGKKLLAGHADEARDEAERWSSLFPDRCYIELQRCGRAQDDAYVALAVELALEKELPVVATNDVRFLDKEDFDAHEVRVCIHEGYTLNDGRRPRLYTPEQYLKSPEQMARLFADIPEALQNTVAIARRCNLGLEFGQNYLPDFPVPDGHTAASWLREESARGLDERLKMLNPEDPGVYQQRLHVELDVIEGMGFPGYFLIVADFIAWARDNGVPVGPGRGSGAGSLVAYALEITDLDPIAYDLLFERFLNPERISMPDFDIDFCMDGRDRVIEYVAQRYGSEKVSQIITYGSMAAKAVVRDVGRVLGQPYGFCDRIAKMIPFEIGMTLKRAITGYENDALNEAFSDGKTLDELIGKADTELAQAYRDDDSVAAVFDMALSLEGLARNAGKHAGGVVIAPSALTDFTPLYCEPGGQSLVTQFDKDDVEAVGLVKFDFLGLRTLTIIDRAVRIINKARELSGEQALDIRTIELDDSNVFDMLQKGETHAVFQLESSGMRRLIKDLKPDKFEDIIALVALFRPGPLQSGMVADFIDRKHGRAELIYPHPSLEPILEPTYGIILYQEQVMQIAQVLSGYSLGDADLLRRAMGKKKPEIMARERSTFVDGAIANNIDGSLAGDIFDLIEKFAGYGFNKSHSAAYALVSYQTAWLKAYYPAAFMSAVLSADMDHTDKVVGMIDESRRMGLEVEPPDVNHSAYDFSVEGDKHIRYGLGAIKGVGQGAIEAMISERENNGVFSDLYDLCRRVDLRKLNKRVLEALICAGAMDGLGEHRASLLSELQGALAAADQYGQAKKAGQSDMFGLDDEKAQKCEGNERLPRLNVAPWADLERLRREKESLGLYLTGHPFDAYAQEVSALTGGRIVEVVADASTDGNLSNRGRNGRQRGKEVTVAGLIVDLRRFGNRTIVSLDDKSGRIDCMLFERTTEACARYLQKDEVILVKGRISYDDFSGGYRITADELFDVEEARIRYGRRILLKLPQGKLPDVEALETVLSRYRNDSGCIVSLRYGNAQAKAWLNFHEDWRVQPCDALLQEIEQQLGRGSAQVLCRNTPVQQ